MVAIDIRGKSKDSAKRKYLNLDDKLKKQYSERYQGADIIRDAFFCAHIGLIDVSTKYGVSLAVNTSFNIHLLNIDDEIKKVKPLLEVNHAKIRRASDLLSALTPEELALVIKMRKDKKID